MTFLVVTSLAAALALPQASPVPPTPDFSGSWTMDRARSQTLSDQKTFESIQLIIKQTAAEISIETTRGDKTWVKVYPMDKTQKPGAAAAGGAGTLRAYWDGTNLITEAPGTIEGKAITTKEVRSLNAAGTEMTVESVFVVHHGYSIKDGKNYSTAKDVFTRVKRP